MNILKFSLVTRLLRGEIHHILDLPDNSLLVFFDNRILKIHKDKILSTYTITTCRRPINVCYNSRDNLLAWGDYTTSTQPQPIHIFVSEDLGVTWVRRFTFKPGQVRHIHNIIFDQFRNHYWVLTGDADTESGIWKTTDFLTLEPILIGSQKYRAVSLIPLREGLIIPSDTPLEENNIRFYSFKENRLIDLQKVNGSCMFAGEVNGSFFVNTMYEPSRVNKYPHAEVWHSPDGFTWKKTFSFKKDILPPRLFQYPLISLPIYDRDYSRDLFYFGTRAVRGGLRTIIVENINEILANYDK